MHFCFFICLFLTIFASLLLKTMIDNSNIEHHHHHHHAASHGDLIRIITASVLYIAANLGSDMIADPMHRLALYIMVYLFAGIDVIWNALKSIVHGEWFDENFLMTVATLGVFALAIIAPLISMVIDGGEADWNTWIYRALTFLVISCPCALVISIPMTFFASIINAGKHGILITDGCGLEQLS